jgi:hypothetical protein
MKRQILIAAASAIIGATGLVGCSKSDTASNNATPTQQTANGGAEANNVATKKPSADTALKDTRATLRDTVEDALTNNDLNKLVGQFTKADRDRIGKQSDESLADLNAAIGQFRRDWKAKYNQDFKLSDKEEVVYGAPVSIQVGPQAEAGLASSATPAPDAAVTKDAVKQANNTTTVTFPKSDAAPAVSLTLFNEGTVMNDYKVDVPDTLDAAALKASLIKHIGHIEGMKDQWPSDVNEASRIVSQHILKAISETNGGGSASIK